MSVSLVASDESRRVELPDDPLILARAVLAELGAPVPARVARETERGFEYRPADVSTAIAELEGALASLARLVDDEGQAAGGRNYFNELQALKAALALFRSAAERGCGARVSV